VTTSSLEPAFRASTAPDARPPAWLIGATGLLAFGCLAMAVAETNLWLHYLIDAGESISLAGVGFILLAGLYLFRQGRLVSSLPLAVPWLLFPVITQGDQIIDNLSINWMRFISHVLLGLLFGTPVAIVVMAVKYAMARRHVDSPVRSWMALVPGLPQMAAGRMREGSAQLAATLFAVEMWVAVQFLGTLMVVTLAIMIWGVLAWASLPTGGDARGRQRGERFAVGLLLLGVATSLGLFVGFKNRPGAYQGSPSYFMDPAQKDAGFRLDRVAVPARPPASPADPDLVRTALAAYGDAFAELLAGYYILDRNYNYDFHNRLFLRSTPLLPDYRAAGLARVAAAGQIRKEADTAAAGARATLDPGDPLSALLEDVSSYAAFSFDRVPTLIRMSADFERTQAGLQHATHLFEGEGKVLGIQLNEILSKHAAVLAASAVRPMTSEFEASSRAVYDSYANRIVGF
jgi:hypothetical protein